MNDERVILFLKIGLFILGVVLAAAIGISVIKYL